MSDSVSFASVPSEPDVDVRVTIRTPSGEIVYDGPNPVPSDVLTDGATYQYSMSVPGTPTREVHYID